MVKSYRTKKIATVEYNYVNVRVYKDLKSMRLAYKKICPTNEYVNDVIGVHCGYMRIDYASGEKHGSLMNETGTVYLNINDCDSWIVAHEFLHALLWSHKFDYRKIQHPISIDSMDQEEDICYGLTEMLQVFYKWLPNIKFK